VTAALLVGSFLVFVILSVPIGVSLGLSAVLYLLVGGESLVSVAQRAVVGTDSFLLLAVPFFVLAGNLMNTGGVTQRLFGFASAVMGRFRGGLGQANVLGSMIFAGMSGSAVADAAGMGTIEINAMREHGYDDDFSVAVTAASAVIGPIIPPSVNMVVYAFLAEVSVGRMFLAGFVPGVLMGISLMVLVHVYAVRRGYPKGRPMTWRELGASFLRALPAMLTPVILLGGMMAGVFTPTEAAVVAALYAMLLGIFGYRALTWRSFYEVCVGTARVTGSTMFIIAMASLFAWVMAREQIPQTAAAQVLSVTSNEYLVLLLVNLLLLLAGCFIDAVSAMIILVPVLLPLQQQLGLDPIQFGLVVVLNLTLGNLTPPVGMVLYVVSTVARVSVDRVVRATWPFLIPLVVVLGLITYVPRFVTLVPDVVMGPIR
jgi:tripartite ATP-independent transporter DctM subunit